MQYLLGLTLIFSAAHATEQPSVSEINEIRLFDNSHPAIVDLARRMSALKDCKIEGRLLVARNFNPRYLDGIYFQVGLMSDTFCFNSKWEFLKNERYYHELYKLWSSNQPLLLSLTILRDEVDQIVGAVIPQTHPLIQQIFGEISTEVLYLGPTATFNTFKHEEQHLIDRALKAPERFVEALADFDITSTEAMILYQFVKELKAYATAQRVESEYGTYIQRALARLGRKISFASYRSSAKSYAIPALEILSTLQKKSPAQANLILQKFKLFISDKDLRTLNLLHWFSHQTSKITCEAGLTTGASDLSWLGLTE